MSISKAIGNAMSGLTATARGTETVASNLSNAMTPGYARREMAVSVQTHGGGVRIDGITRIVNASLLAERRLSGSAMGEASVQAAFHQRMEAVVGLPREPQALSTALSDFQAALGSATTRPDDEIRLTRLAGAAVTLAGRLNDAGAAVQAARGTAQQAIASEVEVVNTALERVAFLNVRITILDADGKDASLLMDQRQRLIDRISDIVPVQEVAREGGKVALFTAQGAVLLDGSVPAQLGFAGPAQVAPGQVVGAPLQLLTLNGRTLSAGQMRLFDGGSLSANFQIRDALAPRLQTELDDLAFDLHQRLAAPGVDPTLGAGDAGLFTDAGQRATAASRLGLAGRLAVNAAVDPAQGGEAWRLRAGLGAAPGGPSGQSAVLNALARGLEESLAAAPGGTLEGTGSLAQRFGVVEARVSTRRVETEADLAIRSGRQAAITTSMMAEGVDSDAEMQRLLQYEQAYAANARVLMAVDDMINQILRM